ncbi:uncharacterized protein [Apostichopus japonicus]|uniref:uncharacterized protein n=1 Tax=Stichopus japonicus TaxID=307972 RepID=UPI003AB6BB4E
MGSETSHLSQVTTNVRSVSPPISQVPSFNGCSPNTNQRTNSYSGKSDTVYLPGFECLVNLESFTISQDFSTCRFSPWKKFQVTDKNNETVLVVTDLTRHCEESENVVPRLECTDVYERPLFKLSRFTPKSSPLDSPSDHELLGYIQESGSNFKVLSSKQQEVLNALTKSDSKITTIMKGNEKEEVGSLSRHDGDKITGHIAKDLDIALKACILARAIDSLLGKSRFF